MHPVAVSTPFNIDLEFEIAAFHKRLLAWFADLVILLLYARGMKLFLEEVFVSKESNYPIGLDIFLVTIPMLFYHFLMEAIFQGQSFGKRIFGIRVISLEGGEPNIGQYLLRWVLRVWEWPLVFGFVQMHTYGIYLQIFITGICGILVVIIIAVTNKSQRLGDLAAGTTVVETHYRYSLADTLFQDIVVANYKVIFPEVMKLSDRDINAIKTVLKQAQTISNYDTAHRVANKIKEVLKIETDLDVNEFLETLLADYNFLATRNN
ncbi:MAG: RDD family protein [Bacteroidota bacterium]